MLSPLDTRKVVITLGELGFNSNINGVNVVAGGCINKCYQIITPTNFYFLKVNEAAKFPKMFEIEAESLSILSKTKTIKTPKVLANYIYKNKQFLLLEWIENGFKTDQFWNSFANSLGNLHQKSNDQFGLFFDNYIGSLEQYNVEKQDWTTFFIENRIIPQVKLAFDKTLINNDLKNSFDNFYKELPNIFPDEKPALIHGDLWSGNFICNQNNEAIIIDPSIYYANREMEIAFTKMFGGFSETFYDTYNEAFPLQANFDERVQYYNLYSLLVHLNLFGVQYYEQVMQVVSKF